MSLGLSSNSNRSLSVSPVSFLPFHGSYRTRVSGITDLLLGEERKGEILGSVNAWMAKEAKEEGGHSTIKGRGNARGLPYAEAD